MHQWEYMVVTVKGEGKAQAVHAVDGRELQNFPLPTLHILINNLGEDGWELTSTTNTDDCDASELFFKRPR